MAKAQFTVGAFAIIRNEQGEILLGQRQDDGRWDLPGGGMEAGENPLEAAVRETKEETGLDVEVARLIGVYSKPAKNDVVFLFECKEIGGEFKLSSETKELRYFPIENLPDTISPKQRERIMDSISKDTAVKIKNQI